MRASDSHRMVFVHIPKTGGATVERVVDRNIADARSAPRSRHDTLAQILTREPELTDYWIFSLVRNPWARLVSWWAMLDEAKQAAARGDEANIRKFEAFPVWNAVQQYPDFDTFVTRGPDELERLRTSQVEFLTAPNRRADFIGRTESISDDVRFIRDRLGLPPSARLPHRHRGTHGPYRDYYTPVTRARVAKLFKADIDEFGYEF